MGALPISFQEFIKKPMLAITYLLLIAVSIMYMSEKKSNNQQRVDCKEDNIKMNNTILSMRVDMDLMQRQLRRADSTMADMAATLRVLKQVGKIQ